MGFRPHIVTLLWVGAVGCGSTAPAATTVPVAEEDTTLGGGDVFDVRVYGEEELSGTYRVSNSGSIDFPFVGSIEVAGLEPPQVADRLAARLRDGGYLRRPQVSVFVQEYNSKRVSVMGAVARPGTFPLSPGLTVVQAISLAGGFSSIADESGTIVTRQGDDQERSRFRVDVEQVTQGRRADVPVRAGDIIFVPQTVF